MQPLHSCSAENCRVDLCGRSADHTWREEEEEECEADWLCPIRAEPGWKLPPPVIDQEVVFVPIQSPPHILLKRGLLVDRDPRGRYPLQLPEHGSGHGLLLVHDQEGHLRHVAPAQTLTQASDPADQEGVDASSGCWQQVCLLWLAAYRLAWTWQKCQLAFSSATTTSRPTSFSIGA